MLKAGVLNENRIRWIEDGFLKEKTKQNKTEDLESRPKKRKLSTAQKVRILKKEER